MLYYNMRILSDPDENGNKTSENTGHIKQS